MKLGNQCLPLPVQPAACTVRLATVHYLPNGKSPRENCEQFAPHIAEAAVLGETVPVVRCLSSASLKKSPGFDFVVAAHMVAGYRANSGCLAPLAPTEKPS